MGCEVGRHERQLLCGVPLCMVLCVLCQREACGCFGLRHGTEGRMLQRELQCPRDGPTALTVKVSDLTSSVEVSNRLKKIVLYVSSGFVRSLWPDWRLKGGAGE